MMSRKRAGLLLATVCTLAAGADAEARQTKVGPSVRGPAAGSPTKPDQDEVVEITQAAPAADEAAHPGQVDLSVKQKLEELEQKNEDLQSKLKDLERRLEIVANPPTAISLRGYIDVGFFGFFRGNGSGITAGDTVPLCCWLVCRHPDDFQEAMWETVSALGDRDTTCAIVGGILACRVGVAGIPASMRAAREPLPEGFEAPLT